MKTYSVNTKRPSNEKGGTIEFYTDDQELFRRVADYIMTCVNAINYEREREYMLRCVGERV